MSTQISRAPTPHPLTHWATCVRTREPFFDPWDFKKNDTSTFWFCLKMAEPTEIGGFVLAFCAVLLQKQPRTVARIHFWALPVV